MDGFLIINKSMDYTSNDVCQKLKRILKVSKIGHNGTLDPMATGVLVIALGAATKCLPFLENNTKEYETEVLFGYSSDTYDITGTILKETAILPSIFTNLDDSIDKLSKTKTQIPPMYSAIKQNGVKLYKLARQNIEIKREERPINIHSLKRTSELKFDDKYAHVSLKIEADKGIYIRSLVYDLGQMMNIETTMKSLVRLRDGNFTIKDAKTIKEVESNDYKLYSIEEVFSHYHRLNVEAFVAKLISNGTILDQRQCSIKENLLIYYHNKFIALYQYRDEKYHPIIVMKELIDDYLSHN